MSTSSLPNAGYSLGGGGGSSAVDVQDEGVLVGAATTINFRGAGVVATAAGPGVVDVTVPGGATESTAIVFTGVAGELISTGEPLRFDRSGTGRLLRAQATTTIAADVVGVAKAGAGAGAAVTAYVAGEVAVRFLAAPGAASNGARVYLDAAAGGRATLVLPSASGTCVTLIGFLTGANGVTTSPTVVLSPRLIYQNP